MSTAIAELMTLEEFHALPEDPAVDRELLDGRLLEYPMTKRNQWHAGVEAAVAACLQLWNRSVNPRPGKVYSGEVGCDLPAVRSGIGIDVAFFGQNVLNDQPEGAAFLVGPPVLAVEILSASEVIENLQNKIRLYLRAGVKLVWVIDPRFRTVTEYQPDAKPRMYVEGDVINGDPHLPGLTIEMTSLFE